MEVLPKFPANRQFLDNSTPEEQYQISHTHSYVDEYGTNFKINSKIFSRQKSSSKFPPKSLPASSLPTRASSFVIESTMVVAGSSTTSCH